ncbi:MAG: hypothetical protein LJE85_09590 [Gammaproteobacteria bacterium]|nr:hypothetical protein [Gammaproteobacteria bacterium]
MQNKHYLKIVLPILATILLVIASVTTGCQQNDQTHHPQDKVMIQSTVGNLPKFINLPEIPIKVKWLTEQLDGDNWSLTAMLEFTKTDFDQIISQSSKHETPNKPKVPNSYLFGLLPESTQQQYSDKKSEEYIDVDTYTIAPDAFVNVNKSPLVNGDAVVFEDEHVFLLHLYTM